MAMKVNVFSKSFGVGDGRLQHEIAVSGGVVRPRWKTSIYINQLFFEPRVQLTCLAHKPCRNFLLLLLIHWARDFLFSPAILLQSCPTFFKFLVEICKRKENVRELVLPAGSCRVLSGSAHTEILNLDWFSR